MEKGVSDVVREGFLEDTLWKPENGWDVGRRRKRAHMLRCPGNLLVVFDV